MKYRSYNEELIIAQAMFLDLFNDIVIDRRDKRGNIEKEINVPCLAGQRSRILKSLENRGTTLKLPLITINMDGMYRDNARVANVNEHLNIGSEGEYFDLKNCTAVPVNVVFSVSIMTKYIQDTHQILSNFIPFFNPDVYVTWPGPNNIGNIKSQVVWDGRVNLDVPDNLDKSEPTRILSECTFELKTWIFPGLGDGQYPYDAPLIYKVNFLYEELSGSISVGELNAFYEVPNSIPFVDYIESIEAGDIKYPNFDPMQYPHLYDSEAIANVSGVISGDLSGFI